MIDKGWARVPQDLIAAAIDWQADLDNPFVFHADHGGVHWTLKVNDFPEQVMFSLFRSDALVAEFDNRPSGWHMHRER